MEGGCQEGKGTIGRLFVSLHPNPLPPLVTTLLIFLCGWEVGMTL